MKRMFDTNRVAEFFIKAGLIVALAAALLMPTTVRLHGNEASGHVPAGPTPQARWETLPLPPVPYLETMPWLLQQRGEKGFKIDTLLAPKLELPVQAQPLDRDPVLSRSRSANFQWNG